MEEKEEITANLAAIHRRMREACSRSGRKETDVRLLLATKTVTPERIRMAIGAGENLIGENKVQEYKEKFEALKDLPMERHFIGHLQTNKVKEVLNYVSCIESVDRWELAEKLDRRLQQEGRSIDVFIEVNTSHEASKSGVAPEEAMPLLEQVHGLDTLHIKGLMTIGLPAEDPELIRPCFKQLFALRRAAIDKGLAGPGCELSMGMSHDLDIAIEEGATIVRVGSAIFGKRNYAQ